MKKKRASTANIRNKQKSRPARKYESNDDFDPGDDYQEFVPEEDVENIVDNTDENLEEGSIRKTIKSFFRDIKKFNFQSRVSCFITMFLLPLLMQHEDDIEDAAETLLRAFETKARLIESEKEIEQLKERILRGDFDEDEGPYIPPASTRIDLNDRTRTWDAFRKKWLRTPTITAEQLVQLVKELKGVYAYIHGTGISIEKDIDFQLRQTKGFTNFKVKVTGFDKKPKLYRMEDLVILAKVDFDKVFFRPYPENAPVSHPRAYNLYNGFNAKRVEKVDMKLVDPVLKHLREVICSDDPQVARYVESWFATLCQNPNKKIGKALVLVGSEGIGKGVFMNMWANKIVGNHAITISGIDSLFDRFNENTCCKVLINVDEVQKVHKYSKLCAKMKYIITEGKVRREMKYMAAESIDDFANFVFSSNYINCFHIDETDRRFVFIPVSSKYLGNKEYFVKLAALCEQQEVADHVYTYFLDYVPMDITHESVRPHTFLRDILVENSKSSSVSFIEDLIERNISLSEYISDIETRGQKRILGIDRDGNKYITVDGFMALYKHYCSMRLFRTCHWKTLRTENLKFFQEREGRKVVGNTKPTIFYVDDIWEKDLRLQPRDMRVNNVLSSLDKKLTEKDRDEITKAFFGDNDDFEVVEIDDKVFRSVAEREIIESKVLTKEEIYELANNLMEDDTITGDEDIYNQDDNESNDESEENIISEQEDQDTIEEESEEEKHVIKTSKKIRSST